jgi:hypothetical protein
LGILASQTVGFAADPTFVKASPKSVKTSARSAKATRINDVALGANGTLSGLVVDEQGYPLGGALVTVHQGKTVLAKAVSSKSGTFKVSRLRAGVYQVTAGGTTEVFRVWAENTAPPSARKGLLMVVGNQVVRGQVVGGGLSTAGAIGIGLGITGLTLGTIALKKNRDTQKELDKLVASLAAPTP